MKYVIIHNFVFMLIPKVDNKGIKINKIIKNFFNIIISNSNILFKNVDG